MGRKDFKRHNESFICGKCKTQNGPAVGTERNHCRVCLHSLHVDEETPGDRKSLCRGLMEPFGVEYRGAKGFMIVHRCIKCGKKMANRLADDDDKSILLRLSP